MCISIMAPQNLHPPLLHRQINKTINASARDLGIGETETSRFGQSRQNIARGWAVKLGDVKSICTPPSNPP